MKILIYKRTHKGDPDHNGIFGNQDCMGRVRNWNFDAVIGIGGKAPWKEDEDIRYKINWIGLGPKKIDETTRGPRLVFSHFELFEEKGKTIEDNFPNLFGYMYDSRKRFDMSGNLPEEVFQEVQQILDIARNSPQSPQYDIQATDTADEQYLTTTKCQGCFSGKNMEIEIDTDSSCQA